MYEFPNVKTGMAAMLCHPPPVDTNNSLTTAELNEVLTYDSVMFGFWNPNDPSEAHRKRLIVKAIHHYEHLLQENKNKSTLSEAELTKSFLILGHLNLLIGEFAKALSAYQHHFRRQPDYWKDSSFLYGLGLVYFYYNLLEWATKAFIQLRSTDPHFVRIKEVNLRLGIAYKLLGDYQKSLMYFQMALDDPGPCTLSKYEIDFHICHLHESQGEAVKAKDFYQLLLSHEDLPPQLRTSILRQLSWLFMCAEQLGETNQRNQMAQQYLQDAVRIDGNDPQNYYLLGRCFAALGMVQQAFHCYRSAIDKSESNADTWCSIGVLYQQQCQAMDSLQAYVCSIQLEPKHVAAWTNLGILYDQHQQFYDAQRCYQNALQFSRNGAKNTALEERQRVLEDTLQRLPSDCVENPTRTLPTLDEAWNLPIPNDLNQRQQVKQAPNGVVVSGPQQTPSQTSIYPPWWPSPQTRLQNGPPTVPGGPNQNVQLGSASSVQRAMQLAAVQLNDRKKKRRKKDPNNPESPPAFPVVNSSEHNSCNNNHVTTTPATEEVAGGSESQPVSSQNSFVENSGSNSDGAALASTTEATNLNGDKVEEKSINENSESTPMEVDEKPSAEVTTKTEKSEQPCDETTNGSVATEDAGKNATILCELVGQPQDFPEDAPALSADMSAEQVFSLCKKMQFSRHTAVYLRDTLPKIARLPGPQLAKDKLVPPIATLIVETKRDALSVELRDSCLAQPVCIIRGLTNALRMDLSLFSTKRLVELHPDHQVEVRTQFLQAADDNRDSSGIRTWKCESARSFTTIQRYAVYQAQTFQDSLNDEKAHVFRTLGNGSVKSEPTDVQSPTPHSLGGPLLPNHTGQLRRQIRFGTNVDLSNEEKWQMHIHELTKLPTFLRVQSASNMLSHVGYTVQGMNSIQLYMKVPGCRTPGHQENLNFASININIGPGECEWFGVQQEYVGPFYAICQEQGVDFASGSWWPLLEHLYRDNIPVCRFIQRPGDIVWVGAGTVHWVQSNGWCNNIAWNVGPLTPEQIESVVDRYEFNKSVHFKSLVPIVQLAWNLAQNLRLSDAPLLRSVKILLAQSLRQLAVGYAYVENIGKKVVAYPRKDNEPAHYCASCEAEVFDLLFLREREKKYLVLCLDCAIKLDSKLVSITVLNQYELRDLFCIFNGFQLKPSK